MKYLFVILLNLMAMNQQGSFFEKVSSNFDRYSYFLVIEVRSAGQQGAYVIENDDLFRYLQTNQPIEQEMYQQMVTDKLTHHLPFDINPPLPQDKFMPWKPNERVDRVAKKGRKEFLKTYFRGIALKDGISDDERTAIIRKLFQWEIPSMIDDETGYLVIIKQ